MLASTSSISSASCFDGHAVIELELGREHDLVGPDVLGAQVDDLQHAGVRLDRGADLGDVLR